MFGTRLTSLPSLVGQCCVKPYTRIRTQTTANFAYSIIGDALNVLLLKYDIIFLEKSSDFPSIQERRSRYTEAIKDCDILAFMESKSRQGLSQSGIRSRVKSFWCGLWLPPATQRGY